MRQTAALLLLLCSSPSERLAADATVGPDAPTPTIGTQVVNNTSLEAPDPLFPALTGGVAVAVARADRRIDRVHLASGFPPARFVHSPPSRGPPVSG